jgi:spermidine/putrescine transport system ATP-binding protein
MNKGFLEQVGTPTEIYEQPATRFVAEFIGETNMLTGTVRVRTSQRILVDCEGLQVSASPSSVAESDTVTVAIRPEKSTLSLVPSDDRRLVQVPGRLTERIYCGGMTKTVVTLRNGKQFVALEKTDQLLPVVEGDELFVHWDPQHGVVLTR